MKAQLILDSVAKTFNIGAYNEITALDDVSLSFEPGEHVLIVGPNGSGKSTLLNVIDGRFATTRGRIVLDNRRIDHLPVFQRAQDIYRLFQDTRLGVVELASIRENMTMVRHRGRRRSWIKPLVHKGDDPTLAQVVCEFRPELAQRLDEKVYRLSPGELQAVTLAMLRLETQGSTGILLADEPTASLEPLLAEKCGALFRDYSARGWLCLVVTHDERLMASHVGRIVRLDRGAVAADTHTTPGLL